MPAFSTWSAWQLVSEQSHTTFSNQWQVFYQALPLLAKPAAEKPPTAWYDFYFANIYPASSAQLQLVASDLRAWQQSLAARLADVSAQLWRSPEEKLALLAQWLAEFDLFLPLQAKAYGQSFDSFRDWLTQLSELENFTTDITLKNAVRELRWQGFSAPLTATATSASRQSLDWHWQEILRLLAWQQGLLAAAVARQPKVDFSDFLAEKTLPPQSPLSALAEAMAQLEQRLTWQRQQLKQLWQQQDPARQSAWFAQAQATALAEADAQLAKRFRQAEVLAIFALRQKDKQLHWLEQNFEIICENSDNNAANTAKLTKPAAAKHQQKERNARNERNKKRQQLHGEWLEMELRFALNQRFGRGFVDGLSLLVLFATLGLLLLFMLAAALPPLLVVIVDTALCALLLLDFFLRWSFSPDRQAYFRRHWLLGLLPALPFGLLLFSLETLLHSGQNRALEGLRAFVVLLRQLRPLIQLLRLLLLFFRTLDDLIRRHAFWLNRDLVFYSDNAQAAATPAPLAATVALAADLEHQAYVLEKDFLNSSPSAALIGYQQQRLAYLKQRQHYLREPGIEMPPENSASLSFNNLINSLKNADAHRLQRELGEDFAKELQIVRRLVRWSPLRWLPPFHLLMRLPPEKSVNRDSLAQLAGALGDFLQHLQQRALFFADLAGVITPSQLVHRLGDTLVQTLKVPRNRLLSLAIIILLLSLLLQVFPVDWLKNLAEGLRAVLAWPVLLLGALAFLGVALGNWLKKIAHSQSEMYLRLAKAQFLEILEAVKAQQQVADYHIIYQRILYPESVFQATPLPVLPEVSADPGHDLKRSICQVFEYTPGSLGERVYLWYQDYLDGAPLSQGDHKTTTQLLGNPLLQNLFQQVLRLSAKEMATLKRLDLRQGGGIGSPGMWFHLITDALAHRLGALLDDYNRHAEAQATLPYLTAAEQARFQHWLQEKQGQSATGQANATDDDYYASYSFTALDFLTNDSKRLAAIAAHFGQAVADCLVADRQKMLREIFGSALPSRATAWRFNPYQWYQRYLRAGRFFLLPFYGLRWLAQALKWLLYWLKDMILEVLNPAPLLSVTPPADFAAARRKIQRFRAPVFLTLCRLRAQLDAEYLGLVLPGLEKISLADTLQQDLAEFPAENQEIDYWHDWRETKAKQLLLAEAFLSRPDIKPQWQAVAAQHGLRPLQAKRYLMTAYLTNYRDLALLLTAPQLLQELADTFAKKPGRYCLWWRPLLANKASAQAFAKWWKDQQILPSLRQRPGLYYCFYTAFFRKIEPLPQLRAHPNAEAEALAILLEVLRHHRDWQSYLVSIRMLHTLAWLDYQTALFLVEQLGGYPEAKPADEIRISTL